VLTAIQQIARIAGKPRQSSSCVSVGDKGRVTIRASGYLGFKRSDLCNIYAACDSYFPVAACVYVAYRSGRSSLLALAIQSALAGVGQGAKDGAGIPVHDLPKVHGDSEQEDQKEEIYAKK